MAGAVENLHFRHVTRQLCGEVVTKPGLALTLTGTLPDGWYIPPNADYHGRSNGAGGWAHELKRPANGLPLQFSLPGVAVEFGINLIDLIGLYHRFSGERAYLWFDE